MKNFEEDKELGSHSDRIENKLACRREMTGCLEDLSTNCETIKRKVKNGSIEEGNKFAKSLEDIGISICQLLVSAKNYAVFTEKDDRFEIQKIFQKISEIGNFNFLEKKFEEKKNLVLEKTEKDSQISDAFEIAGDSISNIKSNFNSDSELKSFTVSIKSESEFERLKSPKSSDCDSESNSETDSDSQDDYDSDLFSSGEEDEEKKSKEIGGMEEMSVNNKMEVLTISDSFPKIPSMDKEKYENYLEKMSSINGVKIQGYFVKEFNGFKPAWKTKKPCLTAFSDTDNTYAVCSGTLLAYRNKIEVCNADCKIIIFNFF